MERVVKRTAVVFGATGYIGGYLVDDLLRRGHEVVVVTRGAAGAEPRRDARAMSDAELGGLRGRDVVVVNLAYPRAVPGLEIRAANERLLERVTRAVDATGARRLVHTSTQAVFGYEWTKRPTAGAAPRVLGDSYIESKRHAEEALHRHWRRRGAHDLAIVRLGNILGAGAMPWVTGVAQRILEGRAAVSRGGRGLLNGTQARNIADYLTALVEHDGRAAESPGVFHHLAERSELTWRDLVEPMSRTIGVRALYREDVPYAGPPGVGLIVRSAVRRFAAPIARSGLVSLVQRVRPAPEVSTNAPAVEDPGWHIITGGDIAFPAALLPGWTPPQSFESMIAEIDDWLPGRGYTLHADVA